MATLFKKIAGALLVALAAAFTGPIGIAEASPVADRGAAPAIHVEIRREADAYRLIRSGATYFIKGVGGSRALAEARALGANSVRTWGPRNAAAVLEKADGLGMSVLLGVWLSHRASDYTDAAYKARKSDEVRALVEKYRNHRALLMWSLGNEINLQGADTAEAWQFVDALARLVKRGDPGHPVISVIAFKPVTLDRIARFAPGLDAVGINAYGALPLVRDAVDRSAYTGPYLVTEWGVTGHWEAERTDWGRPIEPTSAVKATMVHRYYVRDILGNSERCLGSYVFLWGQKQERTPTWYSLLIENLPGFEGLRLFSSTVDAMSYNWRGIWPDNRAPEVSRLTINGLGAKDGVVLESEAPIKAAVSAHDPESTALTYVWEILAEPTVMGVGGSHEKRPPTIGSVRHSATPALRLTAPCRPGVYRLFVYAVDDHDRFGTANIPFRVAPRPASRPACDR